MLAGSWVRALDEVLLGEVRKVALFLVAGVDSLGVAFLAVGVVVVPQGMLVRAAGAHFA